LSNSAIMVISPTAVNVLQRRGLTPDSFWLAYMIASVPKNMRPLDPRLPLPAYSRTTRELYVPEAHSALLLAVGRADPLDVQFSAALRDFADRCRADALKRRAKAKRAV